MAKFSSVLIANRGEIAVRVIRTAREMGLRTVAVYSEADAGAPHVAAADQAICIGPAPAQESYLNGAAILDAARQSGAGAIHPGYGFLSENADFAAGVEAAGLVFVGPDAHAIEAMGDKAGAKIRMLAAGVPCVPGYEGADQSDAVLKAEAERIGFPVMVKASAGGGGKGMRLVTRSADLPEALTRARAEALASFANDRLIIERAIQRPRHVEIQVFADTHGNVIHLGERDCSVQRRHQKVVEEAPSPAVDESIRQRMGAAAVAAAKAVGYRGAGTVEFLLDETGDFFFLEMNTRLQVEHPVTEMVTGLDLVAMQFAVAQGEALALKQDDLELKGHAIEVRLYAEDPANGFLPVTGQVALWKPPQWVRVDSGIATGVDVSPHYDPMLGKVIAYGETREVARARLIAGLREMGVLGLTTNTEFLIDVLSQEGFASGQATTAFLEEFYPQGWTQAAPESRVIALAAVQLLSEEMRAAQACTVTLDAGLAGFSSDGLRAVPVDLEIDAVCHVVEVAGFGMPEVTVNTADGKHALAYGEGNEVCRVDGQLLQWVSTTAPQGGLFLQVEGRHMHVRRHRPWRSGPGTAGKGQITAPMPGLVVSVQVAAGDVVAEGQTLAVLEAMKMQHQLVADQAGVVGEICVAEGAQVVTGALVVIVEDAE
ncbi:acetyl-CoA carboxylase biotin carboxylase subunit [Shimia aestuarii]|uniref:Geranyl-CoA carboxylase alpha subunit n=1 Tax=Shimia aestuarii TaxID=254406 RepID=A0A1I4TCZ9_9RHOB|nr:acetyl-CoA carboxylase biotin carboxylase subunit [Shimia aestuarii]SFM74427.1 geranyl-CoA carboxylase alpha subunit [Shimia aestuarii]